MQFYDSVRPCTNTWLRDSMFECASDQLLTRHHVLNTEYELCSIQPGTSHLSSLPFSPSRISSCLSISVRHKIATGCLCSLSDFLSFFFSLSHFFSECLSSPEGFVVVVVDDDLGTSGRHIFAHIVLLGPRCPTRSFFHDNE